MPIRTVKQQTDRGKITYSSKTDANTIKDEIVEFAPTSSELRLKKLFEYAQLQKDQKLQTALGFITTDYIADKNALPLSAYRIKKIVDDIKAKSPGKIEALQAQFLGCFSAPLSDNALDYLSKFKAQVKTASNKRPPVFRRVS